MTFLANEICAQPDVIAGLIERETANARAIAAEIRRFKPSFVHIAARGSSDNAARYAQYVLGALTGLPVALAAPSLHTLYRQPPNLSDALVIGISQSGESHDTNQVIIDATEQGALTLAITNYPDSPVAQNAAFHLHIGAGEERSVTATKTYTAQLTAIALLGAALADEPGLWRGLDNLAENARAALALSANVERFVERYRFQPHFAVIGRGFNTCTAFEISLKLKELCYVVGGEYSEADFRHGAIAMIEPGFPVIVIAPTGATTATMRDFIDVLRGRQAETLLISDDEVLLSNADCALRIPSMPEWLTPICAVLPGQQFAMRLAVQKGLNIDAPRGLTKVTIPT